MSRVLANLTTLRRQPIPTLTTNHDYDKHFTNALRTGTPFTAVDLRSNTASAHIDLLTINAVHTAGYLDTVWKTARTHLAEGLATGATLTPTNITIRGLTPTNAYLWAHALRTAHTGNAAPLTALARTLR